MSPRVLPYAGSAGIETDAEVAAVATYVRNSWGHAASAVTEGDVSSARHSLAAARPVTRGIKAAAEDEDEDPRESNPPEEEEPDGVVAHR